MSHQNSYLRIGLAGCGEVTEHKHLPGLMQLAADARVVAVADPDLKRAQRVAERYKIPHAFSGLDQLLANQDVDVVGVLTPPAFHREVAEAAMRAGKHVLIEKPIALRMEDADALIATAERSGVRALMGFHMRWHRLIRRGAEAMRVDAVGAVESIRGCWNSPRGDTGTPAWKHHREEGGGAMVEIAVHLFDLWRYLLNDEIEEVFATSRHGVRDDENVNITAVMRSGTIASAQVSERTAHNIEVEVCGSEGRIRIACQQFDGFEQLARQETSGAIGPRLRQLKQFARELPGGVASMRRLGDYGDSYREMWRHMIACLRDGTDPECTLEDGRKALRAVLAAAAADTVRRPIRLAKAPGEILSPQEQPVSRARKSAASEAGDPQEVQVRS